jgi:hypothetical protein
VMQCINSVSSNPVEREHKFVRLKSNSKTDFLTQTRTYTHTHTHTHARTHACTHTHTHTHTYNIKYIFTIYTRLVTCLILMYISRFPLRDKVTLRLLKLCSYVADVAECSRALDIELSDWCCNASMV